VTVVIRLLLSASLILAASPAAAAGVQCPSDPAPATVRKCVQRSAPVLDTAYSQIASSAAARWTAPHVVTFRLKPPKNPCHDLSDGGVFSSFYCPDNSTVYMMLGIADESTRRYARQAGTKILRQDAKRVGVSVARLRKGYPAASQVNVLAHEMAHQILQENGIDSWYKTRADRYEVGASKYDRYGFAPETMADCLSGAVVRPAKANGSLRMNAFDQWAAQADYTGADPYDDARPTRSPFGYPNPWGKRVYRGYGGPYIRVRAWRAGWEAAAASGNPLRYCVDLAASWKKVPTPPFI